MTCPRSHSRFMATCLGVSLGHRSLDGASLWDLGDLVEQTGLTRGVRGWGSAPKAHSASQGRVEHPLGREGGIINNNTNKRVKTKLAGSGHFLNKEISLISWLI